MKLPFNIEQIFSIDSYGFNALALDIFQFQASNNYVYAEWLKQLQIKPSLVQNLSEIPFLPIEFFKTHSVTTQPINAQTPYFQSSSTTQTGLSKHFRLNDDIYNQSIDSGFRHFLGNPKKYAILALLPNYLQQQNSSLVYMVDRLILQSENPDSGFFLDDLDRLKNILTLNIKNNVDTFLFGVTFALMDLIEDWNLPKNDCLWVMETGGMKGRRKELIRSELHHILCGGYGVDKILSEYGMTELFSQAYSLGNGIFKCPPWMQVQLRETDDPLSVSTNTRSGGINVIDLANVLTCSFISTSDLGRMHKDCSFEVLGRFDHSDIRGCNLLVQ